MSQDWPSRKTPSQPGRWRVASYNLRAFQDDVNAAIRVLRTLDADIVLLQEIPRSLTSDQAVQDFAGRVGLDWVGRTKRVSGVSLLTHPRMSASLAQDRVLPVEWLGNPRAYTVCAVQDEFGFRAAAVAIHLPLVPQQRRDHAQQILAELSTDANFCGLPWLIGGDINEDSSGSAWQVLAAHANVVTPLLPSFPAHNPHRAIDAIFATGGVIASDESHIELDRGDLVAATDHLPVWADVQLPVPR